MIRQTTLLLKQEFLKSQFYIYFTTLNLYFRIPFKINQDRKHFIE